MLLDSPLQQTFGVELEFVVRVLPQGGDLDQRTAVQDPIARLLIAGGFSVNDTRTSGSYERWSVERDGSIRPEESDDPDPDPRMAYFGVELKSRVLPLDQTSFEEIRQVVDIVNLNFRVVKNWTTGFHVHVGNGNRGFPLRCLQNLAELVTIFEHQIHSLHPGDRIENFHCQPPSRSVYLHGNPFLAVSQIEMINDLEAFIDHMNPGDFRFMAYNFLNLQTPQAIQTVEFRQHEGTMNTEEILAWVEFTTGVVSYCHRIPPDRLMTLMLTFGVDDSFSVLDLLRIIGKSHLIPYYRRKLVNRDRPQPRAELTSRHPPSGYVIVA